MTSGKGTGGSDDGERPDAYAGEHAEPDGRRKQRSTRLCCLCPQERGPIGLPVAVEPVVSKDGCAPPPLGHFAGPFLPDRNGIASTWVHDSCVMWCPEVYFDQRKQRLKNVTSALKRGAYIKCNHCGLKGATVGCTLPQCPKSYHLVCAHAAGCRFNAEAFTVLCPDHGADRRRAPAPLWSKTMNGDPAALLTGDEPAGAAPEAPEGPKQGERSGLRRSKRKRIQAKGDAEREEDKDRADMHSQAEKILAAVMAAGQRLRREEEHVSDDEEAFAKRERRRMVKDKSRIPCVTVGGSFRGGGVEGDDSLPGGWETLAGMEREIKVLKEVALLPLVYPEAFERLGVNPGRGVLLHGPPGTGKTAAVRALLGAAARGPRPVSFFNRKGADCLGKYMGEAERSLRLLFQEAERRQPSIIFFDEVDGLAPARKSGGGSGDAHDQIHGSVVATLLALMDGLNPRGSVVVVAATNRPDAVDPALRRPGRFDRELHFSLPGPAARREILRLHTREWRPQPPERTIAAVAARTEGAAGADLRALCSAALLSALRRRVPRLLSGDATRERLAAELEPMLPEPPRYQELLDAAKAEAAKGHTGARLAVHEFEAIGARVEVFWSGNDTFFPGIITAFDKASLSHRVTYDEGGEHHWLRLWREGEVIRVLSFRGDEDGKDEGDKEDAGDGANDEGTPRQKGEQEVKPETKSEEERQVVPVNDTLVAMDVEEQGAKSEPNEPAEGEDAEAPVEPLPPLPPQLEDVPCLVCGRLDGEEDFVLCDGCPNGGHYRCLRMDAIPTGEWYCDECQKKGKVCKPNPAPTEDENPVMVVCKNKVGMFHPGQGTNGMIRCLCGPCEVATREGRHSVSWQEPARWEAHCGMRGTRKWKSSVRVVLNPGKGFLGGPGYQTTPVGKWMEMEREGMSFAQLQARAAATGKGEDGVEMGIEWVPVDPHDVDKCAAQARELREAFLVASTKRSGLRVTAGDWAAALSTSTGPCARRSAAGGALAAVGAPLPRHLAPALAAPLVDVLIALNDARAPLEPAACAAAEKSKSTGVLHGDPEAILDRAGVLDGSAGGKDFSRVASKSNDDGEDEDVEIEDDAPAAEVAAAALHGSDLGRQPRPARVLICGDGGQGQQTALAAATHMLQGVPSFTVSLASLISEGDGDPAQGCVRGLKEPLRQAARTPSLLHLSRLESWALASAELPEDWAGSDLAGSDLAGSGGVGGGVGVGVAPSHLWDLFEQTVGANGPASGDAGPGGGPGSLVVIATTELPAADLPERVLRFFQPGNGCGAGATCAIVDLSPPNNAARAAVLARGAATIVQGAVAPALTAAAARAARLAVAKAEADAEAARMSSALAGEEGGSETAEQELARLKAEKDRTAELLARETAAKILGNKAKDARARVTEMIQSVAKALSKTPRFAAALKDHPPAAATIAAALAGEFASPVNFLAALRRGVAGLVPTRLRTARGMYVHITAYDPRDGTPGAAAAAATDTAESWLHDLRGVVAAAEEAETEYFDAQRLADEMKRPKESSNEGDEGASDPTGDATETGVSQGAARDSIHLLARDSIQPPLTPGEQHAARNEERRRDEAPPGAIDAVAPSPVAETPSARGGTTASPPPSSRPSERARRYVHAAEEAARHVGPSVSETAAAAASLAAALTSLTESSSKKLPGVDALDGLLGACAGLLTRAAREATAPFSLEGLLRDATGDIEKLAADCVARA